MEPLKSAYTARLPIAPAKKHDLLKPLKDRVIPSDYTEWYTGLPSSTDMRDCLPAPSADEEPDEAVG